MTILGIDTSFDDTAAAVVRGTVILSNVLSSQLPLYQEWGGVVPRLARQSHIDHIDQVIAAVLQKAHCRPEDIDAIAVTQGPGLAIALEIGIAKAKALAAEWQKPVVAVNHMEGHLLSYMAMPNSKSQRSNQSQFPMLGVLVSGGHTQFVLAKAIGSYEIVGETQDDAMGEALDKVGRMLGLGYPAGAVVEQFAREGVSGAALFPVPMRSVQNANMSFSGLKTAASRMIDAKKSEHDGVLTKQDIANLAYGFQDACMTHLCEKLQFVLDAYLVQTIVVGGGVVANRVLRSRVRSLAKKAQIPVHFPYTKKLCVDNAAMIALVGSIKADQGQFVSNLEQLDRQPNLSL